MTEPLLLTDPAVLSRVLEVNQRLRERLISEMPFTYAVKGESPIMRGIAHGLGLANDVKAVAATFGLDIPLAAPSEEDFLTVFATTLGQTDYKPKAWFESTPLGATASIDTDAHEWGHGWQHKQGVNAGWWPKLTAHSVLYLAGVLFHDKAGEAYVGKVEGDQYGTTAFCRKWFTGTPGSMPAMLRSIRNSYNLLNVGPAVAEGILSSHFGTMGEGLVPNVTAAIIAAEVYAQHAQDLKGRLTPWFEV